MKNILFLFLCSAMLLLCTRCNEGPTLVPGYSSLLKSKLCLSIHQGDLDESLTVINDFLSTLDYSDNFKDEKDEQEAKIIELKEWLLAADCVKDVEILCVSCIYTLPPQSELSIQYLTDGGVIEKVMDVSMDKPMRAVRFHE